MRARPAGRPTARSGGRPIALIEVLERLREAGGDGVAVYDLENDAGTAIHVHAKCIEIADVWAAVGSDNLTVVPGRTTPNCRARSSTQNATSGSRAGRF